MFWKLQILNWRLLGRGEIPVVRVWPWRRGWGEVGRVCFGLIYFLEGHSSPKPSLGLELVPFGLLSLKVLQAGPVSMGCPWRGLSPALPGACWARAHLTRVKRPGAEDWEWDPR